jgi:AraC-like DNA-binding protein
MKLHIKHMVSIRCKMIVKIVLTELNLHNVYVGLGEIEINESFSLEQREQLKMALQACGLALIEDKKTILVEKIKNEIIEMVYRDGAPEKINFSSVLAQKLHYNYTYLSGVFSDIVGTTIERFIIEHKIERVKQLVSYGDLSLTEIAFLLNYSSVAHLCNQFKKVTGLTPSDFKKVNNKCMYALDEMQGRQEMAHN